MRWTRQGKTASPRACRHCGKTIREGQIALEQDMPNNPITDRKFRVHATCMKALIETCPPDQDEISFNELRDQILATGELFPKESCVN